MLSPKMQRTVRVHESQLIMLSERAQFDRTQAGYLNKRSGDSNRWHLKWFVLYQNMLFSYDSENSSKPNGVILLEHCYCERLITPESVTKIKDGCETQHCFAISFKQGNHRQYEFRAFTEAECKNWIDAIREASFTKLLLQREELEQKHLHLLQIVESEKTAKWQYMQQCEELAAEIKKLRAELLALKKEYKPMTTTSSSGSISSTTETSSSSLSGPYARLEQDPDELRKIKKVQSFFRGWLCRRRWKQIVEQYIKSPHAESMRKRNSLVFRMVEAEEEYMEQLEVLVTCFLRPFKMAASSKKPPCSHEDVNSIFLNSETVLFLHQIFLKGLTSRLESWPTLVLGDLFSMLLPMLSIYQEYVRNHHYSLQVLTECKQSPAFAALLKRLENKPACRGRSLETFLTYPMHQVPRYIITLHELLAHTPHDHVERKSLQNARQQLEDLSRQMHDEVSETENLRKNLAVERMIVEGCDILLDVNQVFVRQGTLIQILMEKLKTPKGKLNFKTTEREAVRQCFLFSNHLIIATRASNGKLHLVPDIGKVPLADALLMEDPQDAQGTDDESSVCSGIGQPSANQDKCEFKIVVEPKTMQQHGQVVIHFRAPTEQEKTAWISDISQCLDNVQFSDMIRPNISDNSSVTISQSIKGDAKLFTDEVDIRFSRTLNSCKVPQIRYASPQRLLQRLTDLRFLSIDFLNTFLLTYRVFTDGVTVLEALKRVFYNNEVDLQGSVMSLEMFSLRDENTLSLFDERRRNSFTPRRISGASSVSGYGSEISEKDRSHSYDAQGNKQCKATTLKYEETPRELENINEHMQQQLQHPAITIVRQSPTRQQQKSANSLSPQVQRSISIRVESTSEIEDTTHLPIPKVAASSSSDTLTDITVISAPSSPGNLSSKTLVAGSSSYNNIDQGVDPEATTNQCTSKETVECLMEQESSYLTTLTKLDSTTNEKKMERTMSEETDDQSEELTSYSYSTSHRTSCSSSRSASVSSTVLQHLQCYYGMARRSMQEGDACSTARSSIQHDSPQKPSKAGVVITSSRQSKRRSSTSTAAAAFAIATSGSSNPRDESPNAKENPNDVTDRSKKEAAVSTAYTMRVLNVLRHWISKHSQDFENDECLKSMTIEFLEEIAHNPNLLPAEHKAASQLLRLLLKYDTEFSRIDVLQLVSTPMTPTIDNIETLSALEIAEQMTYLDHHIFVSISNDEFLGQAWMKPDKAERAPHILLMTKRFNDISRLVASEIIRRSNINARVAVIEKWAAVADIARCLHNFNGVLQICSAFTNTAIYRLKKTWDKVSKTTKQTVEKLQYIVSSDGRFRALRDALHKCDPPGIPYLGLYLTDLSFIEEGTPTFTPDGLLNFSKMRMIAHVIREIRHFQQTPYKIDMIQKVTHYLLDTSLLLDDDELYRRSLEIEPRTSRLSISGPGQLNK